jgi:hypothetical protein
MADENTRYEVEPQPENNGYGGVTNAPYDLNIKNCAADQITHHLMQAWKPELYSTGGAAGQNIE